MENSITRGSEVVVRTAFGNEVQKRVVSGVQMGNDFLVVWVCSPEEWKLAQAEGRDPSATPWPAEDVREREATSA